MNNKPDETYNGSNNFDDYDMSYLDYYDTNDSYISDYNKVTNKDEIEYDYGYSDPKYKKNTTVSYNSQEKAKQNLEYETSFTSQYVHVKIQQK